MSEIVLNSVQELFSYTNIKKLVVFRFLNSTSNSAFGNYNMANQLSNSDVELFEMSVKEVTTIQSTNESNANSYIIHDLYSDSIYNICFFQIPSTYKIVVKNNDTLIIYQKHQSF